MTAVIVLDSTAVHQILTWADTTDAESGLTPSEQELRERLRTTLT